jgi:hypothetical protein
MGMAWAGGVGGAVAGGGGGGVCGAWGTGGVGRAAAGGGPGGGSGSRGRFSDSAENRSVTIGATVPRPSDSGSWAVTDADSASSLALRFFSDSAEKRMVELLSSAPPDGPPDAGPDAGPLAAAGSGDGWKLGKLEGAGRAAGTPVDVGNGTSGVGAGTGGSGSRGGCALSAPALGEDSSPFVMYQAGGV